MCKDCNKENSKKQYRKDRKKRIEYVTNWQADNPEYRREYRRKHEKSGKYKEYKREYMRRYTQAERYREYRRQYMREYYQRKKRETSRQALVLVDIRC